MSLTEGAQNGNTPLEAPIWTIPDHTRYWNIGCEAIHAGFPYSLGFGAGNKQL